MPRMRKTDKYRLLEGRGKGQGTSYVPWLKVHEFGSKGRVHKIYGWKYPREYHLMSDLELYYFLIMQGQKNIIDIREQYPLLPLEQTILIADELNVIHPPMRLKDLKDKTVMTSDFLFIVDKGRTMEKLVRTVKMEADLENPRTIQKLEIEKLYWNRKGVDWGIITDSQIPIIMAKNIYSIYNHYFWDVQNDYSKDIIDNFTYDFEDKLIKYNFDVLKTTNNFDGIKQWKSGESLNFFQYLLTKKILETDFNVKFNFHTIKVWINN
jgi:hypothetical protein